MLLDILEAPKPSTKNDSESDVLDISGPETVIPKGGVRFALCQELGRTCSKGA